MDEMAESPIAADDRRVKQAIAAAFELAYASIAYSMRLPPIAAANLPLERN